MVISRGGPPTYSQEPFDRVVAELNAHMGGAFSNLQRLEQEVNFRLEPPHNDRTWLFHARYLRERVGAIRIILDRFIQTRHMDAIRSWQEQMRLVPSIPTEQGTRLHSTLAQMGLDFESLLVFGNLALDQWAMVVGYLTGQSSPDEFTFRRLVNAIQAEEPEEILRPLWQRHRGEIIWSYYHVRRVRNRFVEHVDQAWYKGQSAAIFGIDFHLAMHPPGERIDWEAVERRNGEFLRTLGRRHWPEIPENDWTLSLRDTLRYVFHGIDVIEDKRDQERVWCLWEAIGGDGPSFHIVATRLLAFLHHSTATMIEIVQSHPDRINGRRIDG